MTDQENQSSSTEEENTASTTGTSPEEQEQEGTSTETTEDVTGNEGTEELLSTEEVEPPVRKTPQDFILQRKQNQLEKERERREQIEQELEELKSKSGMDEEEIPQSAKEALEKVHQERTELEIKNFLYENPKFKPYEKKMTQWANNPAYKSLPIEQLAYVVAGADLMKLGAKVNAEADAKAQQTSTASGTMNGEMPQKPGVWQMSPEEFEKMQNSVLRAS